MPINVKVTTLTNRAIRFDCRMCFSLHEVLDSVLASQIDISNGSQGRVPSIGSKVISGFLSV
jgi:hypothetical protein